MTENEISYEIRGAIYDVYNEFGPGLFESVYSHALQSELISRRLNARREVDLPVFYLGEKLDIGFKIDILVENKVIIELKSVERLAEVHHKQILTYMKLSDCKLGILVNFNVANINEGIFRKVNGLKE